MGGSCWGGRRAKWGWAGLKRVTASPSRQPARGSPHGGFVGPLGRDGQGDAGDPDCRAEPSTGFLLCPPRIVGAARLSLAGDTQARGTSLTL